MNGQSHFRNGQWVLINAKCPLREKQRPFYALLTSFFEMGVRVDNSVIELVDVSKDNVIKSMTLNIDTSSVIPGSWILLDNQSTHEVFSNAKLLTNIRQVSRSLRIHTQAGTATTNWKGDLDGYGPAWHCKGGIANILSLAKVRARCCVTFNSNSGNEFLVHKEDGQICRFKQSRRGLYFMDLAGASTGVTLVDTVAENKAKCTNADCLRAVLARSNQKRMGRPSLRTFLRILRKKKLKNCPINEDDVAAAEHIFGPKLGSLKGKTTRTGQLQVRVRLLLIPAVTMERCRQLTLAADILKVNGVAFLASISRAITRSRCDLP